MMSTKYQKVDASAFKSFASDLVNKIFKLLPMKEEGNTTITDYHRYLMYKLTGFGALFPHLSNQAGFVSLLSSLESLLLVEDMKVYRSIVFECIEIAKKLE